MRTAPALLQLIESHLDVYRAERLRSASLYTPMDYILGIGGKRIRPVLVLLAYQAVKNGSAEAALNTALAVELFHNFTLLHDDIMDHAPLRRGMATVHEKWDTNTAILAGDAMFALCFELLIRDFPGQAAALATVFSEVSVGVCEGQMEDMEMAGRVEASIPEYIEMIRKKTAMLVGGAMRLGALAAGADGAVAEQFYAYGEAAGIGFQLHDDYLDVYAEEGKSGKQVAGDILENKKTYLLLRAFEKANADQRETLEGYLYGSHTPSSKIKGVKGIYDGLGIAKDTHAEIARYFEQAHNIGKGLAGYPGFEVIDGFMKALMKRDH